MVFIIPQASIDVGMSVIFESSNTPAVIIEQEKPTGHEND
jgi:hypothetical protein